MTPKLQRTRPRILYVITRAERGGAQAHVLHLASSMLRDFEVMVATGEEGFLTEACREHGIPVHVLPHLERRIRPWSDAQAFFEAYRLIKEIQPDLIHAHTFKAGFVARLAGHLLGVPSIYTIHTWLFGTPAMPRFSIVAGSSCERLAATWCSRIITVAEAGARVMNKHRIGSASKLVTIHNGIPDCLERASVNNRQPLRIVMVARFTEAKDYGLLLHAFARIAPGPRLWLVGDGPMRSEAEKLARKLHVSERVEFLGDRGDVPSLLARAGLFVLASKSEMLPITILEAMRAGLPIIASDVGGLSEIITHGQHGLLVRSGSIDALADALHHLVHDFDLRLRLASAARKRFAEEFVSSFMEDRTRALYLEVLSESGKNLPPSTAPEAPFAPPSSEELNYIACEAGRKRVGGH